MTFAALYLVSIYYPLINQFWALKIGCFLPWLAQNTTYVNWAHFSVTTSFLPSPPPIAIPKFVKKHSKRQAHMYGHIDMRPPSHLYCHEKSWVIESVDEVVHLSSHHCIVINYKTLYSSDQDLVKAVRKTNKQTCIFFFFFLRNFFFFLIFFFFEKGFYLLFIWTYQRQLFLFLFLFVCLFVFFQTKALVKYI